MKKRLILSLLSMCSIAFGNVSYNATVSPTKANGTFIAGSGIPANGFVVDTAATGESVALKARSRATGQPLSINGNVYSVLPGMATPTRAWWNFDFQFSPGNSADQDYTLELKADFDPGVGQTDFVTLTGTIGQWAAVHPDGFFTNPGGGVWSSDSVGYVYSQSWNYTFGFWGKPYNPYAPGEYDIVLTAYKSGTSVASSSIVVQVVPAPGAALLALIGMPIVGWMKRRMA